MLKKKTDKQLKKGYLRGLNNTMETLKLETYVLKTQLIMLRRAVLIEVFIYLKLELYVYTS